MTSKFWRNLFLPAFIAVAFLTLSFSGITTAQVDFTEHDKISEILAHEMLSVGGNSSSQDLVQVVIEAADISYVAELITLIKSLNGTIEFTVTNKIQAWIPSFAVRSFADRTDTTFVRQPFTAFFDQSEVIGEGVDIVGANAWHEAGLKGEGIKIAIVDSGFMGYRNFLGNELPDESKVVARSFRADGDIECRSCARTSQIHGLAVAEIVHDLAPDATLYLINFNTDIELEVAVDFLIEEGVSAVNTSFGIFNTSCPYQGIGFSDPVFENARDNGIFWAASAGNDAQQHWAGTFVDPDDNGMLNFDGDDESHTLFGLGAEELVRVFVWWDDPCTRPPNEYDLVAFDSEGEEVARSFRVGPRNSWPVEALIFNAPENGNYEVMIEKTGGDDFNKFSILFLDQDPEYIVAAGTSGLTEPELSQFVVSVAATTLNNQIEPFSSRGPSPDGRIKPDISAPDGVQVSRQTFGTFFGTSASSPHVAAAAGLVKFAFPEFDVSQITDYFNTHAEDLGAVGKDPIFGIGLLNMGPAPFVLVQAPAAPTDLDGIPLGGSQIDLTWQDNSDDEDGFILERRLESEESFLEIIRLDPNTTTFSDSGLESLTTYCYQVSSFDSDATSVPSNEACVMTLEPNDPPEADAGPDQTVDVGDSVQLDGTNSSDPDGDEITFNWELVQSPEGSSTSLDDPLIGNASFVADLAGLYELQLTVTDSGGLSSSDLVQVTANAQETGGNVTGELVVLKFLRLEFSDAAQWDRAISSGCVLYTNLAEELAAMQVTLADSSSRQFDVPPGNQVIVCGDVVHVDTRQASSEETGGAEEASESNPGSDEGPNDQNSETGEVPRRFSE